MSDISNNTSVVEMDLIEVALVNFNNRVMNPSNLIDEIHLYESLFENTMSGHLVITDNSGLMNSMPLTGEEKFVIGYKHDKNSKSETRKEFYVYKMDNRTIVSKRTHQYVLHFTSLEYIKSQNTTLSEYFSGKISNIVSDIFERYLFTNNNIIKRNADDVPNPLLISHTSNSYKFIAPYWEPFKVINYLCKKALNKNGTPNYFFFETNQSYEFVSVEELMTYPPVKIYVLPDFNADSTFVDGGDKTRSAVVEKWHPGTHYDYLARLKGGMYRGELTVFDIIFRKANTIQFDYLEDFDKRKHLEKYPLQTENLTASFGANNLSIVQNNYLFGNSVSPQNFKNTVLQNMSLVEQLRAHKSIIEVPGTPDIKVGCVIDFTVPNFAQTGKTQSNEIEDQIYSGKYLVTAIHHIIIKNTHKMIVEIVKDSVAKKLIENT